ncbi:MAG: STAS domain-containing protein [Paracoccaceae bacterium]
MSEPLLLSAKLDLSAALGLVNDLKEIDGDIQVNASEVSHMGSLCVQALLAAARQAIANGHTMQITGISEKVSAQLDVMGLSPKTLMEGAQ